MTISALYLVIIGMCLSFLPEEIINYLNINSNMNVRFSVPNAVDTSELSNGKDIELSFSSQKAVVLPKGSLAIE